MRTSEHPTAYTDRIHRPHTQTAYTDRIHHWGGAPEMAAGGGGFRKQRQPTGDLQLAPLAPLAAPGRSWPLLMALVAPGRSWSLLVAPGGSWVPVQERAR